MSFAFGEPIRNVKKCPACGDRNIFLWKVWNGFRRYHIRCMYCTFCAPSSFTKWGARRKWNRAKNWRIVRS